MKWEQKELQDIFKILFLGCAHLKNIYKEINEDGSDYRPKVIDIQINWNDKWNGCKKRNKHINSVEKMKTLFAFDCSGSISHSDNYFNKLKELRLEYCNSLRGDKFYIWGSNYKYMTESEMDIFISKKTGNGGTLSHLIAEIGIITKKENFEHLIIVTDGVVLQKEIDKCDDLVKKNDLQYSFVSTYIIYKNKSCFEDINESLGCPYSRECPGITYIIDNNGNEKQQASLSREDLETLKSINDIRDWGKFKIIDLSD